MLRAPARQRKAWARHAECGGQDAAVRTVSDYERTAQCSYLCFTPRSYTLQTAPATKGMALSFLSIYIIYIWGRCRISIKADVQFHLCWRSWSYWIFLFLFFTYYVYIGTWLNHLGEAKVTASTLPPPLTRYVCAHYFSYNIYMGGLCMRMGLSTHARWKCTVADDTPSCTVCLSCLLSFTLFKLNIFCW